jgi:hypothetical protein
MSTIGKIPVMYALHQVPQSAPIHLQMGAVRQHLDDIDRELSGILHELAGSASMCWSKTPFGTFESTKASEFVGKAIEEIRKPLREVQLYLEPLLQEKTAQPITPPQEQVMMVPLTILEGMTLKLENNDKHQNGFHWGRGWNAALRAAMDYGHPFPLKKD